MADTAHTPERQTSRTQAAREAISGTGGQGRWGLLGTDTVHQAGVAGRRVQDERHPGGGTEAPFHRNKIRPVAKGSSSVSALKFEILVL